MGSENYDVIVIGAGHAGCEAAFASARLGMRTLMLTIEPMSVAMMPCNPSIGGTGKGQLVREIDALGGMMGLLADECCIQFRMLNASKGPAVRSPRAQIDKKRYHEAMLREIEAQDGLELLEAEVTDLLLKSENGKTTVSGVLLADEREMKAHCVILATGTYLSGLLHVSDRAKKSGPSGLKASYELAEKLEKRGLKLRRFKTGTPARVLASTLDYSLMQEQKGDEPPLPFSFMNEDKPMGENKVSCRLTYTNEEGHRIVAENIEKTAPYGGHTTGTGPRYCLSIEDKVSRFPDRKRHQVFLEPEGLDTEDMYIQGMSTSLPEDIQERFYRSIAGLEKAEFSKYAYSIEYDCLDPLSLKPSLEHKEIEGLFSAGQLNGSSGYEEAAAQGLIAGINAARKIRAQEAWTPKRSEAYIGVLIDDLVTKGTDEPYRIMTSRAEFRLLLRQSNADLRLTEKGRELGLVSDQRYENYIRHRDETRAEIERLKSTYLSPDRAEELFGIRTKKRISLAELLLRPEMTYESIAAADPKRPKDTGAHARREAEIELKYKGYIEKQEESTKRFKNLEEKKIPEGTDFISMSGIRNEAREKLDKIRPDTIGQASRISGVSPADIGVLLVHLKKNEKRQ